MEKVMLESNTLFTVVSLKIVESTMVEMKAIQVVAIFVYIVAGKAMTRRMDSN
jgi:hypothetical protein